MVGNPRAKVHEQWVKATPSQAMSAGVPALELGFADDDGDDEGFTDLAADPPGSVPGAEEAEGSKGEEELAASRRSGFVDSHEPPPRVAAKPRTPPRPQKPYSRKPAPRMICRWQAPITLRHTAPPHAEALPRRQFKNPTPARAPLLLLARALAQVEQRGSPPTQQYSSNEAMHQRADDAQRHRDNDVERRAATSGRHRAAPCR